jgi:hypothetical protein
MAEIKLLLSLPAAYFNFDASQAAPDSSFTQAIGYSIPVYTSTRSGQDQQRRNYEH